MADTRVLTVDRTEAWALWELLTAQLAGFAGRAETAQPWHCESLVAKLAYAIPRFESATPVPLVELDLTKGEIQILFYNVPRTAFAGAPALLLRAMRVHAEFSYAMPLLETEPEVPDVRALLAEWKGEEPHAL